MNLIFALVQACRDIVAFLTMPPLPADAGGLGAAIGEALERFPQDRIVRKAKALAEIEGRAIRGLRRFDA